MTVTIGRRELLVALCGAAAAPPSAASNPRRPMVTVIRPSRARRVDGRIPRHERAVPNSAAPGAGGAHAGHSGAPASLPLEPAG